MTTRAGDATPAEAGVDGSPERSAKDERQLRRLTSLVWCFAARRPARKPPAPKTILECAMESIGFPARDLPRTGIQLHDGRRRIGLVFWIQRRRLPSFSSFWKRFGNEFQRAAKAGLEQAAAGNARAEQAGPRQFGAHPAAAGTSDSGRASSETGPGPARSPRAASVEGAATVPGAAQDWENGLRSRIFRLRRPNIWARLTYGVNRDGVYSPDLEVEGWRQLKRLCLAGVPVGSWPALLGNAPTINWGLIPFGFGNVAQNAAVAETAL